MDPGTKKILGMAFFVLLLVGPALIIFQLYEGMTSSNDPKWPTVNGTIIKSEVVQGTRHSSGRSHSIYVPTIIYKYSVDSIEFEGNKVGVVVDESNAGAHREVAQYPVGRSVVVYYNPDDHSDAYLTPGLTTGNTRLIFAGIAMTIIGIGGLIWGRMPEKAKNSPGTPQVPGPLKPI